MHTSEVVSKKSHLFLAVAVQSEIVVEQVASVEPAAEAQIVHQTVAAVTEDIVVVPADVAPAADQAEEAHAAEARVTEAHVESALGSWLINEHIVFYLRIPAHGHEAHHHAHDAATHVAFAAEAQVASIPGAHFVNGPFIGSPAVQQTTHRQPKKLRRFPMMLRQVMSPQPRSQRLKRPSL